MGSIRIYKGMPPLTQEEIDEIRNNTPKSDDEIDFSDIPAPKPGAPKTWYRVNPRTPEEWEQYYKNCPPHIQKKHERLRKIYGPII